MKRSDSMQILVIAGFAVLATSQKVAAVEITSWTLTTGVQSFFFPPGSQVFDDILNLSNPLVTSSLSSLNNGLHRCQADYDYSWIREFAFADMNTTFLQAIRTPETRTIASAIIGYFRDRRPRRANQFHHPLQPYSR